MIGYKVPPVFASNDTRRIIQTFTRPSDAYLDGTLYGPDVARYPSNSGIKGLRVEEATTNLLTANQSSVETDTTGFVGELATGTRDTSKAWTGAASLKVITNASTNRPGMATTNVAVSVSTAYAAQVRVWAPAGEPIFVRFQSYTSGDVYVSDIGQVATTGTGDWQYIPVTGTTPATGAKVRIAVREDRTTANGITFWVDGLQLEQKAYPTEWQPGGTPRAAETATVQTAGLLVPSAGSVIIRGYWDAVTASATSSTRRLFDHTGAGNINQMILFKSGANFSVQTGNGSGTLTTINWASTFTEGWHTAGVRFGGGAVSLWADGGATAKAQNLAANLPAAFDPTMKIGSGSAGNQQWNNGIAFIYFYNRALSDAEMAAATAGNPPPDFTAYLDYTGGTLRSALRVLNRNFNPDLIAPAGNTFG